MSNHQSSSQKDESISHMLWEIRNAETVKRCLDKELTNQASEYSFRGVPITNFNRNQLMALVMRLMHKVDELTKPAP